MTNISGGASTFIAIGKQTAKGTPQTTAAAFTYAKFLTGTDFQPVWQFLGPVREGGDGLDQRWDMRTAQRARGTLVHHMRPDITGQILAAFFGGGFGGNPASAMTGTPSLIATHTFTFPAQFRSQYWTVVAGHPGGELTHVLYDARPVGMTIEAINQSPLKMTSEWVGLKYGASWGVTMAPVYQGGDPFVFFGASIAYPYAGSAGSYVSQYTVTTRVDVDENLYTNDLIMMDLVDIARTAEVTLREVWTNATNYLNVEYAGLVAPTYNLATGTLQSSHVYSSNSFQINFPLIRWSDSNLTAVDPDNKTVYIDYAGIALAGATTSINVILVNSHVSNYLA